MRHGDLWGEAGVRQAPSSPGGVTAALVCRGSSRWREKQAQWSQRIDTSTTLCLPLGQAELQPLGEMNSLG